MTISGFQRDLARQAANVAGALFQLGMTTAAAAALVVLALIGRPPSPRPVWRRRGGVVSRAS